jgi:hypothetical protein
VKRKNKKYTFEISCGICGKILAKTTNPKDTIDKIAKRKKLKRLKIEFYEGKDLIASEELFICDKCWDKMEKGLKG